jgi:enoyl-[acyl-carrier protein] reductase I
VTGTGATGLLAGRRGVVLGVSGKSGMGFQIAQGFKELGAEIAISHRAPRRAAVAGLAAELGCHAVECDFNDEPTVARAMSELGARFERLDFLIHTLVHVPDGVLGRPVSELSAADFATVMESSVRSLLVAARFARPWLERSESPRIVTLLSAGADFAIPHYHAVGIAKGALASAVRYLAAELGAARIACNAVNFSILETDAASRAIGRDRTLETKSYLAKRSMLRRPVEFDDVIASIAFLASGSCRNVTGETINVDGGFSRNYF